MVKVAKDSGGLGFSPDGEREVDARSLIDYLKTTGKIKQTTIAQLFKARNLYITRGYTELAVAETLKVDPNIVRGWVVQFDWKERRNRQLYDKFCSLQDLRERKQKGLDERHDRIASSMEDIIEDMINGHYQEQKLTSRDIGTLTKALGGLQSIRRVAHDKAVAKTESKHTIALDAKETFEGMTSLIRGVLGSVPSIESEPIKQIPSMIKDAMDIEFEVKDEVLESNS